MLDSLKNFISELTGGEKHPGRFEENDYRLAAAALLIHASAIDGNTTDVERDRLRAVQHPPHRRRHRAENRAHGAAR